MVKISIGLVYVNVKGMIDICGVLREVLEKRVVGVRRSWVKDGLVVRGLRGYLRLGRVERFITELKGLFMFTSWDCMVNSYLVNGFSSLMRMFFLELSR